MKKPLPVQEPPQPLWHSVLFIAVPFVLGAFVVPFMLEAITNASDLCKSPEAWHLSACDTQVEQREKHVEEILRKMDEEIKADEAARIKLTCASPANQHLAVCTGKPFGAR